MINFFRKIRQKRLSENKFRKYLIYGIGEIVLIVVGILLAVQISEWNQDRKNLVEEKLILSRLSNELTTNSKTLSWLLKSLDLKEKTMEQVSSVLKGKPVENDSLFLSDLIRSGNWGWTVFPLQQLIFDELNNTGKLIIIRNIKLRNEITELYYIINRNEKIAIARTSEYPKIIYSLVPREAGIKLKENLSSSEQRDVVDAVINSNLNQAFLFEQNRALYLKEMWNQIEERIALVKVKIELEMKK